MSEWTEYDELAKMGDKIKALLVDREALEKRNRKLAEGVRHIRKWSEQPSGALRPAQILHAVRRMCDDALVDLETQHEQS